jgi:hypothetical protein|tara:strand:+ start:762 stop:1190 length:429 start_codon:yes stop_codon:yes gene_type:complete
MKDEFDAIDSSLEVEAEVVPVKKKESKPTRTTLKKNDGDEIQKDYEYTRSQLYSLIEKGQEAVDGILEVAQESESARSYEVAGQLIKHVADTADKLMDLQKKVKEIDEEKSKGPSHVTNNALFVGSTAELQKMLKQQQNESK